MLVSKRQFPIGQIAILSIAGCSHALSIAWPFDFIFTHGQPLWWLQLLAMVLLAWQLEQAQTKRQGAWVGWLFACVMQVATWWWLFISLNKYGGLAAPLTVIAIVGLAAFLALYYAAAGALFVALAPVNAVGRATLFAGVWLLAELGRVALFTGFPWGEGGYAQLDGPFIGLARIVGVHGLTFISAWLAFLLVAAVGLRRMPESNGLSPQRKSGPAVLVAFVMFVALAVAGSYFAAATPTKLESKAQAAPFSVALLQGNIAQNEKFQSNGGIPDALQWYQSQLLAATASLVVTPETAIPLLPSQLPEGYLDMLVNRFMKPAPGASQTAAFIGLPLGNSQQGYTNSAVALKPGTSNKIYQYDKHHLVPFGEFVHPLFKWFLTIVNIPLADFNSGAISQPSFDWQGQRIAPNICYEDLFGEELAARFIDPALAPTIMVNIGNIAWFGNTIAIDQHLNISRMRALEFDRPMVRATNTGATAIIDHTGQVTALLPRHTRGVLLGAVEGRSDITPYAWWAARFGLWPWWGLIVTTLLIAAYARIYWARDLKRT
jgi:apolipoprotein N-acyltransferase